MPAVLRCGPPCRSRWMRLADSCGKMVLVEDGVLAVDDLVALYAGALQARRPRPATRRRRLPPGCFASQGWRWRTSKNSSRLLLTMHRYRNRSSSGHMAVLGLGH